MVTWTGPIKRAGKLKQKKYSEIVRFDLTSFYLKIRLNEIEWKHPIKGIATVYPISTNNPLIIECQVRNRLEKRMEISLSDMQTNSPSTDKLTDVRPVTPTNEVPKIHEDSLSSDSKSYLFPAVETTQKK
jgi:hypothetical protein